MSDKIFKTGLALVLTGLSFVTVMNSITLNKQNTHFKMVIEVFQEQSNVLMQMSNTMLMESKCDAK